MCKVDEECTVTWAIKTCLHEITWRSLEKHKQRETSSKHQMYLKCSETFAEINGQRPACFYRAKKVYVMLLPIVTSKFMGKNWQRPTTKLRMNSLIAMNCQLDQRHHFNIFNWNIQRPILWAPQPCSQYECLPIRFRAYYKELIYRWTCHSICTQLDKSTY